MGLPRASAIGGSWAIRRPFAGLLLLLGVLLRSGPALADDQAQDFSATVKVDATADNAAAARDLARIDGQRKALSLVVDRLSGSPDGGKLPKLDDKAITDMVESFEVANERMSAVRYLADYTFHFRPSKVRRLVHVADSASAESGNKPAVAEGGNKPPVAEGGNKPVVAEGSGKPIVVLPVYRDAARLALWEDPNAWREAWGQRAAGVGSVELTVPLGDASDLATIDAGRAESGKSDALTAIAQQNGGEEAIVALATARRQDDKLVGLDLSVKRYRSGRLADTRGTTFDANPGESEGDFLKRAADAVAVELVGSSKKSAGSRSDQQATLAASVPLGSLGEWVQVRDRLASVPTVRKVELLSLNRQEAKIQIRYVGNPDQLKSSLAGVDLGLDGSDPLWRLQLSGTTSSR
jgi:Uncharacterized protein conserved in bacteria (DUF2066)